MLGRTHAVGSLALAHAALIGYTAYANRNDVAVEGGNYLEVFGLSIGEPLSFTEYGLMVGVVSCFILILFNIGSGRLRLLQLVTMIGGMGTLYLVAEGTYPLTITLMLLFFALGTILPDIDSETSTLGRYVTPISRAIPHRTITHTIWIVLLAAGVAWYTESVYLLALALGYTLHIVEDSFSKQGIRWFYPVPKWRRKRGSYRSFVYETGGFGENVVFQAAVVLHVVCAGYIIWSSFGLRTMALM
ncbi:metal-dependent hydrolase [Evansella clarkii]|uniref:metal-dependent hydrolase n=1 Tax=Evansella clarkii TaxID=79879 RepID=UPI000998D4D3|nr:metal-dependent hydrolase [Evansella clarkii]